MINYATIGSGWIAESFINGCNLHPDKFKLSAVYSRTYEKGSEFGAKFGCDKVYTDLEAMAKDPSIDAVYIASPNAFHFIQSKIMLQNGKHVICEKPITVTPEEFSALQNLARIKGLIYMEALMAQHLPCREELIDAVNSLGRISHVRFDFSQRSSKYDGFLKGEHQNIFDPKMATGALMDLGIYCVYPCIDLFGKPNNIYAYCNKLSTDIDGEGGAIFHYGGFSAELTYSKTGQSHIGSEIIGDNGTLIIPSISKQTDMVIKYTNGKEKILTGDLEKHVLMSYEAVDFYRYITEPEKYSHDYKRTSKLSFDVCSTMYEMRKQANIVFK